MPDAPSDGNLETWLLWGVTIVVGTLAGAVGILYRAAEGRNGRAIENLESKVNGLEKKLDETELARMECEKDRSGLRIECSILKSRIDAIEKKTKS